MTPDTNGRHGRWIEEDAAIQYVDASGILFTDTVDHFRNGVCRLLGISEVEARSWVARACTNSVDVFGQALHRVDDASKIEAIRSAWSSLFADQGSESSGPTLPSTPTAAGSMGYRADVVWAGTLGSDPRYAVIGSTSPCFGWLVSVDTMSQPTEMTVEYDQTYFEGGRRDIGYGAYLAQEDWRMEKARRQVRQVAAVADLIGRPVPTNPRLLDVGSGYGFFRKAAEQRGWVHQGIEISPFAAEVSQATFGFPSFVGDVDAFAAASDGGFNVVAMWDVLEHLRDPLDGLRTLATLLRNDGLLVLRTPNLDSLEREIFGARYHSFKSEHLFYFGPHTIVEILQRAGLSVAFMTTDSHLLSGFFGDRLDGYARLLKGSDLFVAGVK